MRAPSSDLPVALKDVSIRVRDLAILDCVTIDIQSGPPTILVGPNGSGKTTLIRTAIGLAKPASGSVTWGGRSDVPPLRRAIVFQRPAMLRRSAAGNIQYALASAGVPRRDRKARVDELLNLVGLSGLGDRPARQMSGGEQQRLALARALAKDPDILFLDEPTASLDPAAIKSLEEIIADISSRGIKVVMSTHNLGEARRLAGDVVLMHRGRIVEIATVENFFTRPKTSEARRFIAGELLV